MKCRPTNQAEIFHKLTQTSSRTFHIYHHSGSQYNVLLPIAIIFEKLYYSLCPAFHELEKLCSKSRCL